MIVEARNPSKPRVKARHFVVCEGCKRNGPEVRLPQTDRTTAGREQARALAESKGWLVHLEPVRTPVLKRRRGAYCEQYFCKRCQKAGLVGTFPQYSRSHKKKEPAAAGAR